MSCPAGNRTLVVRYSYRDTKNMPRPQPRLCQISLFAAVGGIVVRLHVVAQR
jgi:hypothetical protein